MQKTNILYRFILGLKRNWKKIPIFFIIPYGAIWGFIEPISFFLSTDFIKSYIEPHKSCMFIAIILISLLYMIYNIVEPLHTKIEITKGRTYLNIFFGDIFSYYDKSHIAISVNEFFDTQIGGGQGQVGDVVAANSVHGLFIKKIYHSNARILDSSINDALQGVISSTSLNRLIGKNRKYPIGTTAVINGGNHKQFLFALAKTDIITNKASADVPTMWYALEGLWNAVRTHSNGLPITIPLVGGG